MKLLTKEITKKLEKTRYHKDKFIPKDAPVLARFFNPTGSGTWSVLEGEKLPNNDWRFFGVVDIGQDKEYGYFNLSQLEEIKGSFGLGIERDRGFKGTRASLDKEYGLFNPKSIRTAAERIVVKEDALREREQRKEKAKTNSLTIKQSAKIRLKARLKLLAKTKNKEEIKSILLNNPSLEFQEGTMQIDTKKRIEKRSVDLEKKAQAVFSEIEDKKKKGSEVKTKSYIFKEMFEIYQKNEDNNFHSENAKLLADTFGTPAEKKKMNEILDRQRKSSTGISDKDYQWTTKNINPLYTDLLNAKDLESSFNGESVINPIYRNLSKEIQEEVDRKASEVGKQMPLMVDLDNKKEVNSAIVAGVPVNNSKKDKTPTQIETLLNRITSWRKKNKLDDSKINHSEYMLDKAFSNIKTDTELIVKQLRKEDGSKKEQAKNLIQLLENSLYGKAKRKTPNQKPIDKSIPDLTSDNFKTKSKGSYPHRVAWLQGNGSWVAVDLNDRSMTTSLELKNILKAGDITEKEINKSLSWMQIEDIRSRPNSTFRILKESPSPPKDINYMSFGKRDLKVTKNGFKVFENRNPKKHHGAGGEERAMKYKRSNYKYPRANNRYSIWNSRKASSKGQVGFKILRKKK